MITLTGIWSMRVGAMILTRIAVTLSSLYRNASPACLNSAKCWTRKRPSLHTRDLLIRAHASHRRLGTVSEGHLWFHDVLALSLLSQTHRKINLPLARSRRHHQMLIHGALTELRATKLLTSRPSTTSFRQPTTRRVNPTAVFGRQTLPQ